MKKNQRASAIREAIQVYCIANPSLAAIDLAAALIFYLSALALVALCLVSDLSLIVRLPLLVIAYLVCGGALAKLFTIQHDCGHNSYFKRSYMNVALGRICSIVTIIPFTAWREEHLEHHACFARTDRQTYGDILLFTVRQFRDAGYWRRGFYRIFRNPIFLVVIAPLGYIFLRQRIPSRLRTRRVVSCASHAVAVMAIYGPVFYFLGMNALALIIPPLYVAATIGVVIFLIEHQFEEAEWSDGSDWQFDEAAVRSSSYLAMPAFLEWVTGYIGYHHLHHLSPKIPSYNLKECFLELGEVLPRKEISLQDIPRSLKLALWSQDLKKLVTFREAKALAR